MPRARHIKIPVAKLLEWHQITKDPVAFARSKDAYRADRDPQWAEHLARCYALGWLDSSIGEFVKNEPPPPRAAADEADQRELNPAAFEPAPRP